ncbi:bifunctional UDP-3-O-[3-hydroxymyristoyl] N-acetylglucosamine deacetylase/3-hydroxyacyl-ACP dehydratase [Portibacter lacus]|uniref:Multifunctional fusion protein n=1 Tax=Portibacter lacus TaxID=1099794 RepID=A0AA37STA4_9BACT|nr:bifunctional UDP-3-O-[3-hydroxymyristoyl] N-acetylglucosamine deacetylase/3-hydroxyacyl-ACP dehydratase [Portibacter lacus]GLR19374.1 3-hydroxyacyl-[acyl-carrier-protein] dehydratase FabZ [Portibacter lacus]
MFKKTISKSVSIEGIGLHTGIKTKLTLHPADKDHGIRFSRTDLEGKPTFLADVKYVYSTKRGTSLKYGEAHIHTVEHILSALTGLGIDNVLIELDGAEIPIMDGSAEPFVNMIEEAGIVAQDAEKEYFIVEEPIEYKDEVSGVELIALPHDGTEYTAMIDFNSPILSKQYAHIYNFENYSEHIAPSRTFVFVHELEYLLQEGLIKGGDLDNAIVIANRKMEQHELDRLAEKLGKKSVQIKSEGVLNTIDLKYKNEPARHKLLDLIGDLTLLGKPIKGKIVATKPGHKVNVEFTKLLKVKYQEQRKLKGKPKYDPNKKPVMDTMAIAEQLPHRYPFLLVDKIIELSENYVVGVKNITFNEQFFQGHFPGNPIFPGVLQMEALAQTGGLLALSLQEKGHKWDTYFLKMENVKFKKMVVPGDTLILKMELMAPIKRGICQMLGTAYVGNNIVSEGELTAQIIKRT